MKKVVAGLLFASPLLSAPTGPTIAHGTAEIIQKQNALEINCSNDLIINWKNFGVDLGESVRFIQPGQRSFVLNRVLGMEKSQILGQLISNGALFLINPNGILIGKDAKIDVGSLVASTLDIKDEDFLLKNFHLFSDSMASIVNLGQIESVGDVYLVGKTIDNQGEISSSQGKVGLAAGVNVLIKPQDEQSLYIMPDLDNLDQDAYGIDNSGAIRALQTEIRTRNGYELAIKHSGKIEAISLENRGGDIYLVASSGRVNIDDGSIVAKKGNDGGQITILGDEVVVQNQASIDVSNIHNGGSVFVGGGKGGKDSKLFNAQMNFVGKEAVIDASSIEEGNGGQVILWADGKTSFYGTIYSQGGAVKGDGGFVEVSGFAELDYRGFTSTIASNGSAGTLLLDPSNITITTGVTTPVYNATTPVTFNPPTNPNSEVNPTLFNQTDLQTALTGGNVIISTAAGSLGSGDISFGTGAMAIALTMTGAGYTLTLNANRDILMPSTTTSVAITFPSGGNGALVFNAARNISLLTPSFTCANAKSLSFTATTGDITNTPTVAQAITFSGGTPTIVFSAGGATGIALGGTVAIGTTINFGTPTTVSMNTTGTGGIALGNLAGGTTAVTSITMGATSSVSLTTVGASAAINLGNTASTTGAPIINFGTPASVTLGTVGATAGINLGNVTATTAAATITFGATSSVSITTAGASANITMGSPGSGLTTINLGTPTTVTVSAPGATADIIFGKSTATTLGTTLVGGASSVLNASAGQDILFNSGGAGPITFNPFSRINFNAGRNISTVPSATGQAINFTTVPRVDFTAASGITIGNNSTANTVAMTFGSSTTAVNMTTTGASADILFGQAAVGTGAVTLTGNSSTVLTATSGRDILFNEGSGAYSFNTFSTISFLAPAGSISMTPLGAITQTFTSVGTINYTALNGILLGQNATALAAAVNWGAATTVNLATSGSNTDITLGGSGAGSATFSGSVVTTLNILPQRKIVLSGTGAGIGTFSSFGRINFFSPSATPTSANIVDISRVTLTFTTCDLIYMYPYNVNFNSTNTTTNINSSTLASIPVTDPAGITIPTTLTINSGGSNFAMTAASFTINGKILDSSTGSITLTSTNAAGDITLQSIGAVSARVGVNTGDVNVVAARDLNVYASNTAGGFAQIGYDSAAVNSDIYLTVGRDVNITGGVATVTGNVYALIGHGIKTPVAGVRQGNIIIHSIGRNLTLTAGSGTGALEGAARMGHFALDIASPLSLSGDIRGPSGKGIIGGDIICFGGIGDQCKAHIGHGASSMVAGGSASISGDILLQCANLNLMTSNSTAGAENFAGIGHKVRYAASGLSSNVTGSVDVKVLGDVFFEARGYGGAVLFGAYINNGPTFTSSGNIDFSLVNLDIDGELAVLGGTTLTPQENKVIIGVYSDLVASSTSANLNLSTGGDLGIISRTADYCYIINGQTPTIGRTMDVYCGADMLFWGEGKSAVISAIDKLNLTVERDLMIDFKSNSTTDYTSIESNNDLNILVNGYLDMTGFGVNGANDAGYSLIRNLSSTVGEVKIICGYSLTLNPFSKIINYASGQPLTIVNDNVNPTPWAYSDEGLDADRYTYVTTTGSGPLRIFVVSQESDDININPVNGARFNGTLYTAGIPYVDTATEKWATYYPSSYGGVPYTFFYKTRAPVPPSPIPINQLLQQEPSLFRPYYEMFHSPYGLWMNVVNERLLLHKSRSWSY